MSWLLVGASLLFILFSALPIINGSCSQSRGLSASSAIYIGGQLSVQSWLAIVGVEFGILGLVIIPCIQSVLSSKILTRGLAHRGMPFSTLRLPHLLVSFSSRSTLIMRIFIFCSVISVSVLYKFSFVLVGGVDIIVPKDTKAQINMGCDNTGCSDGISSNFLDALSTSNSSSAFSITIEPALTYPLNFVTAH